MAASDALPGSSQLIFNVSILFADLGIGSETYGDRALIRTIVGIRPAMAVSVIRAGWLEEGCYFVAATNRQSGF